jgi:hypothetical protein
VDFLADVICPLCICLYLPSGTQAELLLGTAEADMGKGDGGTMQSFRAFSQK